MLQFVDMTNDDEGQATLEILCYNIEADKVMSMLKEAGPIVFSHIDSDSLTGEYTGKYNDVMEIIQTLKSNGFTWDDRLNKEAEE